MNDREERNAEQLSPLAEPACWHTCSAHKVVPYFLQQLERSQQAYQIASVQRSSSRDIKLNFPTWCRNPLSLEFEWLANWAVFAALLCGSVLSALVYQVFVPGGLKAWLIACCLWGYFCLLHPAPPCFMFRRCPCLAHSATPAPIRWRCGVSLF